MSFAGTLESFNFADTSTPYPISLDYAVCIKKSAGFCGVSVNTFTEGDAVGLNANSADPTQFFDEGCSRATATDTFFNADYIAVLGGNTVRRDPSLPLDTSLLILSLDSFHLQVLTGVEVTEVVRFCGVYDTSVGGTTPFPGVTCKSYNPIPISYSCSSVFILLCRLGPIPGVGIAKSRLFCHFLEGRLRNRLLFEGISMQGFLSGPLN